MLSLCLHLSSISFYFLITVVIMINYGLECVTCLGLAYILFLNVFHVTRPRFLRLGIFDEI